MRRKFWQFVHNRLEDAWHWVYYHKLARPLPEVLHGEYLYTLTYVNKDGLAVPVSSVFSGTKIEQFSSD